MLDDSRDVGGWPSKAQACTKKGQSALHGVHLQHYSVGRSGTLFGILTTGEAVGRRQHRYGMRARPIKAWPKPELVCYGEDIHRGCVLTLPLFNVLVTAMLRMAVGRSRHQRTPMNTAVLL